MNTADSAARQCSCCGRVGIVFGSCSNCYGCGPEGRNHDSTQEVWSQHREDEALAELDQALENFERIRAQRSTVAMFSKPEGE